jgi:site-specific recombinase XerD
MDRPPKGDPLPRAPHIDDLRRFFEVLTEKASLRWQYCRDLALFSLAIDTGGRIGELAALTVRDVELGQGEIFIKASKTRRQRSSVFGPQTEDEVKQWLECRATLDVPPHIAVFFVSKHRGIWQPFTHWGMRQALRKWCKWAQIDQFNFHALRHAYAIFSLRNHADLIDVQHQLGHRRLSTTSIYTQVVNLGRYERHRKTSPRSFLNTSS